MHDSDIIDFRASKTNLFLSTHSEGFAFTPNFTLERNITISQDYPNAIYTTGLAEDGMFFLGTNNAGILHNGFSGGTSLQILPEGPLHNDVFTVDAYNGEVWIAYGDVSAGYNPYPTKNRGISKFQNEYWTNIPFQDIFQANDLVKVRIHKKNPEVVYFTSYQKGLVKVVNDEPAILYNETNSPLEIGKGSASYGIRL